MHPSQNLRLSKRANSLAVVGGAGLGTTVMLTQYSRRPKPLPPYFVVISGGLSSGEKAPNQ
jgi:hypothetical protein